ncbi:MAG TPA: S9 family peptidase [Egibacteraceae bacterium]|nr:S9 family peptidase [Egibacteraceae bacterium]
MQIRDLGLLRTPAHPTLTPDGSLAAVALARMDLDADAYRSEIWIAATDGSAPPRAFTGGPRDTSPRFSPDGRWLAFLRAKSDSEGPDGKPQLHVMPVDGGEPRQVCEHPLGISEIAWAPDSRRIAYSARVPEPGRYGTDPSVPADKEPPRRITTRKYRLDDVGFTSDRRPHVFAVDALADGEHADSSPPRQLTDGDYDHGQPAWSPDGEWIALAAARHVDRDSDLAADVFAVPAGGGDLRQLTDTTVAASHPAFSADGQTVFFCSPTNVDFAGRNTALWSVPADGSLHAPRIHSNPEADDLDAESGGLRLLVDDESVTAPRLHRGAVTLVRYPVAGGAPTPLVSGQRQVHGYDRARDVDVVVAIVADATSAGELVVLSDNDERVLSDFGAPLSSTALRPMNELTAHASDGAEVHGWAVKPSGDGPFPVVLMVHGGPFAQYGWTLFDEAQVCAGAGYAVVMGNPRGSSGYGEAHGRAIIGALGAKDADDLLALLDGALEDPDLDGQRIGVMGGSYGGFMTTWLAARTDRFAAGISERAVNAWDSFLGTSDIGWFLVSAYCGEDPDGHLAQSPLTYADDITAPMLLIHSEQDWRCPIEQAQRLYERLHRTGAPAELLVFPGEGHELSRSGLPSHRVARFEAILEWWERHLKRDDAARDPES